MARRSTMPARSHSWATSPAKSRDAAPRESSPATVRRKGFETSIHRSATTPIGSLATPWRSTTTTRLSRWTAFRLPATPSTSSGRGTPARTRRIASRSTPAGRAPGTPEVSTRSRLTPRLTTTTTSSMRCSIAVRRPPSGNIQYQTSISRQREQHRRAPGPAGPAARDFRQPVCRRPDRHDEQRPPTG